MDIDTLNGLFKPKSVAVIGASSTVGKIGHTVVLNLTESKYEGNVYPINPKADEILGFKCYPTIQDVKKPIDLAIITIPAKFVSDTIDECGKAGVKGVAIITSGFAEVGLVDLEKEIVEKAHSYGMRVLGPNIVGILSNSDKFNGSFAPFLPFNGKGSLVSQSGALLIGIDAATYMRGIGFDKLISIGNMSDVNFADTIEFLDNDPNTSCISLYIEGFKDGRRVIDVSRKAKKPIVALKSGVSAHGAAAAASHTGSLAGAAKVYKSAFAQAGIIQAEDLDNLFDRTLALSLQPPLKNDNVLIITNGGGVGVLGTDAAEKYGIPLKFAPEDVQEELKKHMPEFGSAKNPVDLTGMAGNEWYFETVNFSISHKWVQGLVVLYCETAMTDPMGIAQAIKEAVVKSGIKDKPVAVSFVGGERSEKAMHWLVENGIPAYQAPDIALNAMAALREYAIIRESANDEPFTYAKADKKLAMEVINKARSENRNALTEIEAKEIFSAYGMPVTKVKLSTSEEEAVKFAEEIGFPVVMKIVSPDILHKSDAGGVKVNITDEKGVREAYKEIMKNAKAYKADANIHGIVIQEMAPWGTEVILGSVNDPTFGPTLMFGLGGIFVEVMKDVTFKVAPFSAKQAESMLTEIKAAPILAGTRGEKPRDRKMLANTICLYANMIVDLKDEISESDANPVLVYEEGSGLKVADARIILKKK
ncbi:acetate--CoA ligase family protein [Pelolinea submarina]|uniref:Acetyltransferase n=1 Tax=Pelolinea submarina TaxID=913107 RepID=A0A347ZTI3_9CHLR|nr:acetate--CoA ligase family protein [Pelolinea submarina]REG10811.1 acetyltransferase [Pelolinea submarina]BBB48614.1 acetyltransferase [Pelolinea submarina]